MNDLYLSLGSNITPEVDYLKQAIELLNESFELIQLSSLYVTRAVDDPDQNDFYNLCAYYCTNISDPYNILKITQGIENKIGRQKDPLRPKGPRAIDIDILLFSFYVIDDEKLRIPHPGLFTRRFMLEPLVEIIPGDAIFRERYNFKYFLEKNLSQKVDKRGVFKFE